MSLQFDFVAGLDISPLSSVTQAQIMQMVNQIAPLSNIGGIVAQARTNGNSSPVTQGTENSPDVTNNPRFARYIWVNTYAGVAPVPYTYNASDGKWYISSVATGSVFDSHIAATAEIAVSKLADGAAYEIIATDGAGTGVAWTSVATLLSALNDSVPLTAISDTGAPGAECFLRRIGSAVTWKTFADTVTEIQNALSGVSPTKLSPGANNTLLGTNGSGVVEFNTVNTFVPSTGANRLNLSRIHDGGAASGDMLKYDGTAWVKFTPSIIFGTDFPVNSGIVSTNNLGTAVHTIAHGLGVKPKMVRVVARCIDAAGDVGWAQNDEVDINAVWTPASFDAACYGADATNITIAQEATILHIANKATGTHAVITNAKWKWVAYAWA